MKNLNYTEGIFFSKWLSKFINQNLKLGKTFKIEKMIYYNFFLLKKNFNFSCLFFLFEVLEKIKPSIGLKIFISDLVSKKKPKAIPFLLHTGLQYKKALYWLWLSIKTRKENTLLLRVYNEFYDILINESSDSLKKKKEYYKHTISFKTVKRFKW